MSARGALLLQAGYAVAAACLLAFAQIAAPPRRLTLPAAAAAGIAAGAVLYVLLVRRAAATPWRLLLPALAGAVSEEVVWRWGVLAGTAPRLGWGGALALSSVGFAYRHTRSDGLAAYLALGLGFGGVFLATGRLAAAVAAHAAYNALVLLGGRR
jgi:membrane protease YdiL (CAAX protease family)